MTNARPVAIGLLLLAVGTFLFSVVFTYRWYEGTTSANAQYSDGECHSTSTFWRNNPDGCRKNATLQRENANRDLRYALGAFCVAVVAGGTGVALLKRPDPAAESAVEQKPPPISSAAEARLTELDRLHGSGLLTEDEYTDKRKQILDEI